MRKTLVVALASFLAVAAAAPATATTKDDGVPEDPFPGPIQAVCAVAIDLEPPAFGELPVFEDPVIGTAEGVSCAPEEIEPADAFANADVEAVVASEETHWEFKTNAAGQQTGQIRIRAEISPAGISDGVLQTTVTYKVTITPAGGGAARTETVVVQAHLFQGTGNSVGGHNTSAFPIPIPQGAKVKVQLETGSGHVRIGNAQKPYTIKAADQGERVRP